MVGASGKSAIAIRSRRYLLAMCVLWFCSRQEEMGLGDRVMPGSAGEKKLQHEQRVAFQEIGALGSCVW